ncbi:hypothetical protein H8356DRAFT_1337775 [Neocallimastix lanati (nom. inval.)]|nr:hypothetical protein H8356DRAFT_1337775 [Neocallimastix sp. JGI-2020a]
MKVEVISKKYHLNDDILLIFNKNKINDKYVETKLEFSEIKYLNDKNKIYKFNCGYNENNSVPENDNKRTRDPTNMDIVKSNNSTIINLPLSTNIETNVNNNNNNNNNIIIDTVKLIKIESENNMRNVENSSMQNQHHINEIKFPSLIINPMKKESLELIENSNFTINFPINDKSSDRNNYDLHFFNNEKQRHI